MWSVSPQRCHHPLRLVGGGSLCLARRPDTWLHVCHFGRRCSSRGKTFNFLFLSRHSLSAWVLCFSSGLCLGSRLSRPTRRARCAGFAMSCATWQSQVHQVRGFQLYRTATPLQDAFRKGEFWIPEFDCGACNWKVPSNLRSFVA